MTLPEGGRMCRFRDHLRVGEWFVWSFYKHTTSFGVSMTSDNTR